ncbi:hypothetical protein BJ170DRAFT_406488 [Xylariales sp. AK1849]|nr:hypothetical protein BJ170DRAFT_406488 [Xylariales sp. AK1849]
MVSKSLLPESISAEDFTQLLDQYPALIDSISNSKPSKPGQKTLSELDDIRFNEAVELFSLNKPRRAMKHDDVKVLVEWKLRHGKFRPTLMKLVSSNDEQTVQDTMETAMKAYRAKPDVSAALGVITRLRGIGPATASLLLSVHDPDRVIFFSDESFYWLCCGGDKSPIKYTAKEYRELTTAAQSLVKRLGVSATNVEKVAYVVMKQGDGPPESASVEEEEPAVARSVPGKVKKEATKRKETPQVEAQPGSSLRRSKRGKVS